MEKKLIRRLPKRVTVAWAAKYSPCSNDVMAFKDTFPKGIEVTRANMHMLRRKLSHGAGMIDWLFEVLKGEEEDDKLHDAMFKSAQGRSIRKHRDTSDGSTIKSRRTWSKKMLRLRNNFERKRIDLIADAFNLP